MKVLKEQPVGLQEGIYFDLDKTIYHNDPALSHSGMTHLLVSWPDYWARSCHNPYRKEYKPTEAMILGDRRHTYLLENRKFYEMYGVSGSIRNHKTQIFLASADYDKIKKAITAITSVKAAADHFKNGYSEVTVIWRDKATGVMLRVRIDYLHIFGAMDYKSIMGLDDFTIGKAVKSQGLDIQNYLYVEGIKAARRMLMDPACYIWGEVDLEWLQAFKTDKDLMFRFLFQRSTPPYIWAFKSLAKDAIDEGDNATHRAIHLYSKYIKKFGTAEPPAGEAKVTEISTFHIPRRNYDYAD